MFAKVLAGVFREQDKGLRYITEKKEHQHGCHLLHLPGHVLFSFNL